MIQELSCHVEELIEEVNQLERSKDYLESYLEKTIKSHQTTRIRLESRITEL